MLVQSMYVYLTDLVMPANVTLFNHSCEKIYDFGSGHRNTVSFNAHGNNILYTNN